MDQLEQACQGEKVASLPAGGRRPLQGGERLQPPDHQVGGRAHQGSGDVGQGGRWQGQDDHGAAAEDCDDGKVEDDAPGIHQPAAGRACQDREERLSVVLSKVKNKNSKIQPGPTKKQPD